MCYGIVWTIHWTMLERGGENALQAQDVDRALADMLGAGGKLGARMLGADQKVGFAAAL